MKKLLILGLAFCFVQDQPVKAQYYYYNDRYYDNDVVMEIGATFGIMNAFTDLGGKKGIGKSFIKDLYWKNSKASYGLYAAEM